VLGRYLHVVVQKLGRKISPVRPNERVKFWMDRERLEVSWITEWFEHRTLQSRAEVDFSGYAISESKPHNVAANVTRL
jgi:hypothetical protein